MGEARPLRGWTGEGVWRGRERGNTASEKKLHCGVEFIGAICGVRDVAFGDENDHSLTCTSQKNAISILSKNPSIAVLDGDPPIFRAREKLAQLPTVQIVPNEITTPT
jgi:hypothetical protein